MAAARPAFSTPGCSHCRSLVLNLFAGHQPQNVPVIRSVSRLRPRALGPSFVRRFSTVPKPTDSIASVERGQESSSVASVGESTTSGDIPWYLQVEPPTHVAPIEPAPLPEVPPDALPFIRTLLEYVSEELGLDALNLLDLRKLNPAPALGPNLFMLFGTARSERHLNVSAGRLVRWLRAKHRIHADADGLLGPNERKLKLRRKARRAKLTGTMGTDEGDDGIRTGWICVNLGTVDRGGPELAVVAEDGRLSGFGVTQAGSTIVVQIMTESRRAEMELETLWTEALERSISASPEPTTARGTASASSSQGGRRPKKDLHPVEQTILANLHRPSPLPDGQKSISPTTSASRQARSYTNRPQAVPHPAELDPLTLSSPYALQHVLRYEPRQKYRVLDLLRTHLDRIEGKEAYGSLMVPAPGSLKPPFVELMEGAMRTLPPHRTWEYRLAFQYKVGMSNLGGLWMREKAAGLVREMCLYGIPATREQYIQLLTCIFHSRRANERPEAEIELALRVITAMYQRNEAVLASDVIATLIEGLGKGQQPWTDAVIGQLEQLLYQPTAPCMDEPLLMRLVTVFCEQQRWRSVWRAWRQPLRYLRPRSRNMYLHLFQSVAATGNASLCALVVRRCLPEMESEGPAVHPVGDVLSAILACVDVASPYAQKYAKELAADSLGWRHWASRDFFVKLVLRLTLADIKRPAYDRRGYGYEEEEGEEEEEDIVHM